jgi:hypothetical protein
VGDYANFCGSLACVDGVSGTCNEAVGPWARRSVTCFVDPEAARQAELGVPPAVRINERFRKGSQTHLLWKAGLLGEKLIRAHMRADAEWCSHTVRAPQAMQCITERVTRARPR